MSGKIIIRLKTDVSTGKFEAKILGHQDGASCSDGLDEAIIKDLLNAKIDGFDDLSQIQDSYKTSEYFEEKNKFCSFVAEDNGEDELVKKKNGVSIKY